MAEPGSPPRPWGPHGRFDVKAMEIRFTPTPVGTTSRPTSPSSGGSVHPHARGDHAAGASRMSHAAGSPPRPWGPPGNGLAYADVTRFTPTPVGTTRPGGSKFKGVSVHPHARGDHGSTALTARETSGSPPRPWGPHPRQPTSDGASRFTPTPVGTTPATAHCSGPGPVHPHARGDHGSIKTREGGPPGSPPRPWGPLKGVVRHLGDVRFTPTPVGTTGWAAPGDGSQPVHPHARGDHAPRSPPATSRSGSPPRPWGPRRRDRAIRQRRRFTPTPVGTTGAPPRRAATATVHPHARGDHVCRSAIMSSRFGSPPRPWGPLRCCKAAATTKRFTPTPVGTTTVAMKLITTR